LKIRFFHKKAQSFQPRITDSEVNAIESFIDFLKGVLRMEKETRWSPNMAMTHPFITRSVFTGPFEP
jgi:dual specificity protein kinase YAK1